MTMTNPGAPGAGSGFPLKITCFTGLPRPRNFSNAFFALHLIRVENPLFLGIRGSQLSIEVRCSSQAVARPELSFSSGLLIQRLLPSNLHIHARRAPTNHFRYYDTDSEREIRRHNHHSGQCA